MLNNHYLAKYRGRNVIAFPLNRRHGLFYAALRRYQPDTTKRALFRYWLKVATFCRLPGVWGIVSSKQLADLLGFDLEQWLDLIKTKFDGKALLPVIIWPPEASRKRIYVHLLNTEGQAIGFAKIAFDLNNNDKIQNECDTLQALAKYDLQEFHVPYVIDNNRFGENNYLIVEAVPETVKTHRKSDIGFPTEAVMELSGEIQNCSFGLVKENSWYNSFCKAFDSSSYFMTELSGFAENETVKLCRIHGDFGPSNLLQVDGRLWIIDWEESCDKGPYLTDYISYFLGINRIKVLRKPEIMYNQLRTIFSSYPYHAKPVDIMLALAYLHNANYTLVCRIIDIWPRRGVW